MNNQRIHSIYSKQNVEKLRTLLNERRELTNAEAMQQLRDYCKVCH